MLFASFSLCYGLGLQCVILEFPGHTHLLYLFVFLCAMMQCDQNAFIEKVTPLKEFIHEKIFARFALLI